MEYFNTFLDTFLHPSSWFTDWHTFGNLLPPSQLSVTVLAPKVQFRKQLLKYHYVPGCTRAVSTKQGKMVTREVNSETCLFKKSHYTEARIL